MKKAEALIVLHANSMPLDGIGVYLQFSDIPHEICIIIKHTFCSRTYLSAFEFRPCRLSEEIQQRYGHKSSGY